MASLAQLGDARWARTGMQQRRPRTRRTVRMASSRTCHGPSVKREGLPYIYICVCVCVWRGCSVVFQVFPSFEAPLCLFLKKKAPPHNSPIEVPGSAHVPLPRPRLAGGPNVRAEPQLFMSVALERQVLPLVPLGNTPKSESCHRFPFETPPAKTFAFLQTPDGINTDTIGDLFLRLSRSDRSLGGTGTETGTRQV